MANDSTQNPMIADTASDSRLVSDITRICINSIVIKASNATWAVILKDGAGNIIFDANQIAGPIHFAPAVPFYTTGLVINTLTAATVYIYTNPS